MKELVEIFPHFLWVVETVLLSQYADQFLKRKKHLKVIRICYILIFSCGFIFTKFCSGNLFIQFLIFAIPDILYIILFFHGTLDKKVFIFSTFSFFLISSQSIAICLISYFYPKTDFFSKNYDILTLGRDLLYILLLLIFLQIAEQFQKPEDQGIRLKEWLLLMAIPLISFCVIFFLFPFDGSTFEMDQVLLVLSLAFFLMNLIVFCFYKVTAKERLLEKNRKLLIRATQDSLKKAENTVYAIEERNKQLHDYKKHLLIIQTYLTNEQFEDSLSYVERITPKIEGTQVKHYTHHFLMDSLIDSFLKDQKNLCVTGVLPEELAMDSIDIACLFGNAFENVQNSCKNPNDQVEIMFSYHHSVLECTIENTYTDKKHFSSEGLGISIMKDIIQKYEGEMEIKKETRRFRLYFHIPL